MSAVRVLLVDDHPLLRRGIRILIGTQSDMEVVGEAGDMRQAVELCTRLRPDVVILDLSIPGGSGVAGVERVRAASPDSRVLVLTMHDDPAYVRGALAMGAAGYVVKSAADTELVTAIRAVAKGRVFVDASSVEQALGDPKSASPLAHLSDREREVLVEVAGGHTSQAIADRLGLSVKTVESYRARMMQKLGLKTRADVIRLAVDTGLLAKPE
ncbi:MAG: response regulator [Phycisphaerales bacterium]